MKNILLLVHVDDGQEARLQAALDLTHALDGNLTCVDVTPSAVIAGELYGGFGEALLISESPEVLEKKKAALIERLSHEDIEWNWSDAAGDIASCILKAATLSDLIVLNRGLDGYSLPDMRAITSRIVMHARCPVVAVPRSASKFKTEGRALVAWDGQASAAATMRACVPLLKLASDVRIFRAGNGGERAGPAEAAEYLRAHDIHASVGTVENAGSAADALIAAEARLWHADYVVMGAYSHGRMMEAFGGVTKRMLAESDLPLVLSH